MVTNSSTINGAQTKPPLTSDSQTVRKMLATPTALSPTGVTLIAEHLRGLLADAFVLHMKIKNFHWHMSGQRFREYHLLLDEHASDVFAMTDDLAERARKIGATTLKSIGEISKFRRLRENEESFVAPLEMLAELCVDNQQFVGFLRNAHAACDQYHDYATASLIENWIDQTERRIWFLFEITGSR